jgi:hypothetical protein
MWSKAHRKIFCSLWLTRLQVPHCLSSPKYPLSEWKLESLMLLCEEHVEVVLRHSTGAATGAVPLWFSCWRGTDRSGSWLSGNTTDTRVYVVRAAGA